MAGIESRVAIITGGATGVGSATALMLAARGWRCVINYSRSASEAESTVRQCVALGTKAFAVCGDVARDEACRATADATVKAFGRIDALINSAGTTKFASMDDLDGQNAVDFQEVYAVNVIGAYQMTRAAAPAMSSLVTLILRGALVWLSRYIGLRPRVRRLGHMSRVSGRC